MPRYLWIFTVGLVSIGLWGCGGDDSKKDEKAANNGAAGAPGGMPAGGPGGMMPPGGAGGPGGMGPGGMGPGGMGPGGMGPGGMGAGGGAAAPTEKTASAESGGSGTAQSLLQYIPESVKLVAGANIAVLGDKDTPFGQQVLSQFRPLLAMLENAGIKESQIDQVWSGTDRDKGQLAVCVRTKSDFSASAVTKKLGASDKSEKIGKAIVHKITKSQASESAVAYIDGKTLMVGRYETVVAGLKNPKSGTIQAGLKAMNAPNAYFWISGGDLESMRQLNLRHRENTNFTAAVAATPQSMAIGLTKNGSGSSSSGAGPSGGGGGPGGMGPGGMGPPGAGPGGMGPPNAGPGGAGPGGAGPGGAGPGGAGPGGAGPGGMGPGGMGAGGMGSGGMGGPGGRGSSRPLMVVVGWSFTSEVAAQIMERIFDSIVESMKPKTNSGPGGMGAGMGGPPGGPGGGAPGAGGPPGGPGGPGMGPPGGGGGRRGRGRRGITTTQQLELFDLGIFQQPGGPPAGPGGAGGPPGGPGMGPGGMGPGGMGPGGMGPGGMGGQPSEDDPNITFYNVKREQDNLRLSYTVPKDDTATVAKIIGKALGAIAPPPLDDGLFQGSLPRLSQGFHQWEGATTPEKFAGYRKADGDIYEEHYSWLTELLPFIGYDNLYHKFDFTKTWRGPLNGPYAETLVPSFLNPADPRTMWNERGIPPLGVTHFAGMSGVEDRRNVVAAQLPRTDPRAGIFGYDRIAKTNDITDGTSTTIMMIGTGEVAAPWIMGGGATIRGARQPYFDQFTGFGSRGLTAPGAYILMADGSARVVMGTVDPEIFKAMCTMHGAEQIDMAKLVGQSGN